MLRTAVDERKHHRIVTARHHFPEGRPGHPLVLNASQGGACLWFGSPLPESPGLTLRFKSDGHDRVLHSRIVWSRACAATTSPVYLKRAVGWLAGIAFTQQWEHGANDADIPHDLLRDGQVRVSFDEEQAPSFEEDREPTQVLNAQGLALPDEKSMRGLKAVATELLPLFARHFAGVQIVLKQQQLEISASFRDQQSAEQAQNELPQSHSRKTARTVASHTSSGAGRSNRTTGKSRFSNSRRRALVTVGGVTAVVVAASYLGLRPGRDNVRGDRVDIVKAQPDIPVWASAMSATLVDGWIKLKSDFALTDSAVNAAIELLQHNDLYPPAHDLHDLAKYPQQVSRAFSLIGNRVGKDAEMPELGTLKNELESRLIAGARFPDEAPGGRYSSLQRELYNNVVVLGVVDLLYRRHNDPAVKQLLASIVRTGTTNPDTLASGSPAGRPARPRHDR
jgi:hypothetical protein